MSNETETVNGSKPIASAADVAAKAQAGRRRPAQQEASSSADEGAASAAEAAGEDAGDAKPKRRGPKAGSKRASKKPETTVSFDATTLPPPESLPLQYLIACAKYLRTVKAQIDSLEAV